MFLTTKYEQMVKLEHLLSPKVGGGAQTHLCPPTFESGEARAPPAPLLLRPCVPFIYRFLGYVVGK